MTVYQDMFLDDTVMEMATCQLCTFWEQGTRSSSARKTRDRTSNRAALQTACL